MSRIAGVFGKIRTTFPPLLLVRIAIWNTPASVRNAECAMTEQKIMTPF